MGAVVPSNFPWRCRVCNQRVGWVDCPTGGWYIHEEHPEDDHDAVGPPIKGFNLEQFFHPDSPSGEPVLLQSRDPFTEDVYGPGMRVDQHGNVTFFDEER